MMSDILQVGRQVFELACRMEHSSPALPTDMFTEILQCKRSS